MYTKTEVKPVENFWENDQRPEFLLILRPKNSTSDSHILPTSKSTCNDQVKQYWSETSENYSRKWPKNWILTYLGYQNGPKLGFWGPYSTHRWKYWQWTFEAILMWNQRKLFMKVTKVQNFDLPVLWGPKWPQKMGLWSPYCTHLWK